MWPFAAVPIARLDTADANEARWFAMNDVPLLEPTGRFGMPPAKLVDRHAVRASQRFARATLPERAVLTPNPVQLLLVNGGVCGGCRASWFVSDG